MGEPRSGRGERERGADAPDERVVLAMLKEWHLNWHVVIRIPHLFRFWASCLFRSLSAAFLASFSAIARSLSAWMRALASYRGCERGTELVKKEPVSLGRLTSHGSILRRHVAFSHQPSPPSWSLTLPTSDPAA